MKKLESKVSILEQAPGSTGMFKHIERVARTSYHTEDRITKDSYIKFCNMLKKRGHWSCFEHGTVYLKIPKFPAHVESEFFKKNQYTRYTEDAGYYYFTTNYRELLKFDHEFGGFGNNSVYLLSNFWHEPDENFKPRVTSLWVCSRAVSHELVRHRAMSFLQSSQRYIAYDLEKNGGEVEFIIPQWIYKVQQECSQYINSFGESLDYLMNLSGVELWNSLCALDRTVAGRDDFWKAVEKEYLWERQTDESYALRPEDARGVLCNDVKTEVCMTGFLEDYQYVPDSDISEKAGFFTLRTASDAHPDFRVLAESLQNQINEKYKK